jgi:hypothetical protein
MINVYVLNPINFKHLTIWHLNNLVCQKCGMPLTVGDKIVDKRDKQICKLYHIECYEEMFIEMEI